MKSKKLKYFLCRILMIYNYQQSCLEQMSEYFPTILSTSCMLGKEKNEVVSECPICMDTVDTKINCVITECGHTFHARCLFTNVLHNGFGCPYCRTEMIDPKLLEENEEEEDREDALNTGFFLDDEEDDADSWNPPVDDDDDDDDDDESEEEESAVFNNALRGIRLMFSRAEGDEIEVSEDEEEEDDSESDNEDTDDIDSNSDNESLNQNRQERRNNNRRRNTEEVDDSDGIQSGARVTQIELEREETRLLDNILPNISYILRRFTSSAYNDLTYEEICGCLLRIILWRDFPTTYGSSIRTTVVRRLDYSVGMIINQIIEGYQYYDHEAYLEERRTRNNEIAQALDMGMD